MNNNVLLVLGVCGLALVCGTVLIAGFLLVTRLGGGVMGFFSLLGGRNANKDDEATTYVARPRPNLRRIVDTQDFDAAVAKNIVQNDHDPTGTGGTNSASPRPPSARLDAARRGALGRRPTPSGSNEYSDDEIFGGILDEDGDGSVDNDP
ncbi:MAG: hypothetical protein SGI73_17535 [Chloroflexota bacterium]|nr:hypothetical protein [Chloroflexota bacterium]